MILNHVNGSRNQVESPVKSNAIIIKLVTIILINVSAHM